MKVKPALVWAIVAATILLPAFVIFACLLWGEQVVSLLGGDRTPASQLPAHGKPYLVGTVIHVPASPPAPGTDPALVRILYPFPKNAVIRNAPVVTAISESPNGKYLRWGDDAGNVFVWKVDGDKLIALNDLRLSAMSVERTGIDSVLAVRIYDDSGGLRWMDFDGVVWEAQPMPGDKWSRRALYRRSVGWSGIFTQESFVRERYRNTLTSESVLEKCDILTERRLGTCKLYPPGKGTHFVEEMSLSADERLLAVVSECNAGIVSIDDFRLLRSFGVTGGDRIAISPKGSWVALWTVAWDLFVWDVSTGQVVHKLTYPLCGGGPLAFPSDTSLWFATLGIHRLDLRSGQTEDVIKGVNASQMMFSGDRRRLYVGTRHGALHVYKVPSEWKASSQPEGKTGNPRVLSRGGSG